MTSERTPQDVLRDENERLRAVLIEARDRHGPLGHNDIVARITNVLEGREANGAPLDKAIAEAPDSPSKWPSREEVRQARLDLKEGRAKPLRAPDTLSEKPGLDVERLAKALRAIHGDIVPLPNRATAGQYAEIIARWYGSTDSEGR